MSKVGKLWDMSHHVTLANAQSKGRWYDPISKESGVKSVGSKRCRQAYVKVPDEVSMWSLVKSAV